MRILILCHEYPPVGGGAGNAAKHIAEVLASKYPDCVHFLTSHFKSTAEKEEIDGYTLHRVDIGRKSASGSGPIEWIRFAQKSIIWFDAHVKTIKPDICLAFFAVPSGYAAMKIKKKYTIPYIVSLRGADVPGFLPSSLRFHHLMLKPLISKILNQAALSVGNCNNLTSLAKKVSPRAAFATIFNGFDPVFHDIHKTESSGPVKLLYVGRLEAQKGIGFLLKAVSELKENVRLTVVGDGKELTRLRGLSRLLGIETLVDFKGWVNRIELKKYYSDADIFILPSLDEGMPQALMEAMASGLAVITTPVGGITDIITDNENGIFVEPGNAGPLRGAISKLISNPALRTSFGHNNRKYSITRNWESVATEYESYINSVLVHQSAD